MHRFNFSRSLLQCATALSLTVAALSASASADKPGEGVEVTPIFPSIAEERFRGEVAMEGLRELGYEVDEPKETEYGVMMVALANGDADFTVHLWEKLHDKFYQQAGGDDVMVKSGNILPGVSQGYLIDRKTAEQYNITNLAQLKDPAIAKLFDADGDGKADLTGCNPGWGCELAIENHLNAYQLRDSVTHKQGSYAALMADTIARFKQDKPILYYTWTPYWVSAVLRPGADVVWLQVPFSPAQAGAQVDTRLPNGRNYGFLANEQRIVANRAFIERNPAAGRLFEVMKLPISDINAQNLRMSEGANSMQDVTRHTDGWIRVHQATFDGWIAQARAAAR